MSTKWDDTSWQEEFLEMKTHKPEVVRLLMEGPRGFRDAWQLGALHEEYKRLKKIYEQLKLQKGTGGKTAMKEEIDCKQELFDSANFNGK